MARRPGQGQGPQRQIKGFRPGKEPPQLRKQHVRQQFGEMTPAQQRLVEMLAERTPEEARALLRRQRITFLAGAIALAALALLLSFWWIWAGIIVAILAAVVLFLWLRLHRQREAMEQMADLISRPGGPRGGKRRGR